MVPVEAVGFRCVVDDLDGEEGFFARDSTTPQGAKSFVLVEPDATGIAQIGGDALRLFASAVALDHDAPEVWAGHALDRLDRDPLRLLDQGLPDLRPVPMPPAPA